MPNCAKTVLRIVPWIVTYNGMGTGSVVRVCIDFLLTKAPSFGTGIRQIDIYAHCQTRGRSIKGLNFMRNRFRANLLTLPKAWFKRNERLFEVAYFSRLCVLEDMFGPKGQPLNLRYFCMFCQEFASAMLMIEDRIRHVDRFDVAAFRKHIDQRLNELPDKESKLRRIHARFARRRA